MGRKELLLLSCALGVLAAGSAFAQETKADDAPIATRAPGAQRAQDAAKSGGYVVEELIVTADEHISNLEDAPVAVTTFNAEERNLIGANTVRDLVNLTPGTTLSENGINVRGVGRQTSETDALGSDPGVAYYVNGFYSVVAGVIGESTLYSESIQFLRGPQGTRFGREVTAGTASLWARRPTREWRGEALAQYGRYGFWGLGVNVAGPINDKYGIRFGWQHFDLPESAQKNVAPVKAGYSFENDYLEFQLEGRPTDNLHFWLRSTTFQTMDDPGYTAPPRYATTAAMGPLVPNPLFGYTTPAPTGAREFNVDTKGANRTTGNQVHILNADYDFGPVTLYYVGGIAKYKTKGYSDFDRASRASYIACTPSATVVCAPGTVPNSGFPNNRVIPTRYTANYLNRNQYFTHEIRLQNNDTTKFDWVVGAFYLKSNYNERYWQASPDEAALQNPIVDFVSFAPAAPNPDRLFYGQHNIRRTQNVSVFADIRYHLTDQLSLNAGLRQSRESARATTNTRYIFFNPASGSALDVTRGTQFTPDGRNSVLLKLDDTGTTGRLGLDYNLNDDTLLYAKYSRGFKAGAFNLGDIARTVNNIATPEKLDAFEVGWKQRFSPTLRGDATAFYYKYTDMQIPISALSPTTNTVVPVYTNFDDARIWGLELQGTWTPNESLWVSANYSFLHAETESFCCAIDIRRAPPLPTTPPAPPALPGTPERLDGQRLPRTPEHKANLFAAYTWNFTPGSLILGGSATYIGSQFQAPFEREYYKLPAYTLVNLSATWRSANNQYELVGYVSNVFDENYLTWQELVGNLGPGGVQSTKIYGDPRFYQVQLRYRF